MMEYEDAPGLDRLALRWVITVEGRRYAVYQTTMDGPLRYRAALAALRAWLGRVGGLRRPLRCRAEYAYDYREDE